MIWSKSFFRVPINEMLLTLFCVSDLGCSVHYIKRFGIEGFWVRKQVTVTIQLFQMFVSADCYIITLSILSETVARYTLEDSWCLSWYPVQSITEFYKSISLRLEKSIQLCLSSGTSIENYLGHKWEKFAHHSRILFSWQASRSGRQKCVPVPINL